MRRDRGFTVIELMVVVFLIAVLMALLLPAVQKAREAARRSVCVCGLKCLVLANANYESVHGVFPYGVGGANPPGPGRVPRWSAHSQLLPYMEGQALFHTLNFSGVAWLSDPVFGPPNATALRTRIGHFLCPSDPDPGGDPYDLGHTSFRACAGTKPWNLAADSPDGTGKNDGMFWFQSAVRPATIGDGTHNTAAFSERCLGGSSSVGIAGDHYMVDADPASCVSASYWRSTRYGVPHEQSGQRWGDGALFYTRYNHVLPPNSPSCLLGGTTDHGSPVVVSASSRHGGGVNLATVDGAVRFVKDSIDPKVWRGMATISGGEPLNASSY
jgi:prepilin-type N-terminal cleavage/methylation domain-containing protein/prepilin-type processing-associated H-X9-DG protein